MSQNTNNKYKILVVEDDESTNNALTALLEENGYRAISAKNGANARLLYASHKPDLVILDLGLPDMDGTVFLSKVRETDSTPIIILSSRTAESDKVNALDMGANDYVTKPFSPAELMARVRAALRAAARRSIGTELPGGRFETDGLTIDYAARRVFVNNSEVRLTRTEYNIVALLSGHAGKIFTYSAIIKSVWGHSDSNSTKKLQVNMANIRKKFAEKSAGKTYIVNEQGVGYRMCAGSYGEDKS